MSGDDRCNSIRLPINDRVGRPLHIQGGSHHQGTAMRFPRRQFLHLAAGAASLPAASRFARAQAYPTRPVRIIVGFPPAAEPTPSHA
jgi:hypothetical protein